jgi:DNA-binding ferritin-like protein
MNNSEKTRLDRIEEKIDKMAEAVIALARAEEKISNLDETTRITLKRMVEYDERIRNLEQVQADNTTTIRTIRSIVWTFISGIITAICGILAWIIKE